MTGMMPTLNDLLRIPDYKVFDDFDYICYDRVKELIIQEYGEREIGFETPDKFRSKLNYYLGIRCPVYNKMLESQLIQIDPFMTEYIVTEGKESTRTKTKEGEKTGTHDYREDNNYSFGSTDVATTGTETGTDGHKQEQTDTTFRGKLYSRAENVSKDSETNMTGSTDTDTDYHETKDTDVTETGSKTTEINASDNQTGRTWTEKGDSSGHTLQVHSDTPQAMLFNQPSWLTGAGRTHTEGKLVNGQLQQFAEADPSQIDTANLTFNSGEDPYYQYASTGDNNTGHDSYNKEGTETFNVSHTNNTKEDSSKTTSGTDEINGTKTENTDTTQDTTVSELQSTSENTDEHEKTDGTQALQYSGDMSRDTTGTEKTQESETQNNIRDRQTDTDRNRNVHGKEDTDRHEVRKGRTMRSPSQLLNDYRSTLNYNADMWLIGELEPLFLGIY